MTREEQIIKASQLYAKALQKPFMDGARWADQNPVNYDEKAMLHVLNKGHEQGWKDAIEKACEYLKTSHEDIGIRYIRGHEVEDEIEIFKKYMEEQQ